MATIEKEERAHVLKKEVARGKPNKDLEQLSIERMLSLINWRGYILHHAELLKFQRKLACSFYILASTT